MAKVAFAADGLIDISFKQWTICSMKVIYPTAQISKLSSSFTNFFYSFSFYNHFPLVRVYPGSRLSQDMHIEITVTFKKCCSL